MPPGFPTDQRNGDKEFVIRRAATNRVLNVLRHWVSKHSQVGAQCAMPQGLRALSVGAQHAMPQGLWGLSVGAQPLGGLLGTCGSPPQDQQRAKGAGQALAGHWQEGPRCATPCSQKDLLGTPGRGQDLQGVGAVSLHLSVQEGCGKICPARVPA